MTKISIIGLGTMARTLGVRATGAGHDVQIIGRDAAKAAALATELGGGATASTVGSDAPTGDIVILAVPYTGALSIVSDYGPVLAGKVIVDISNPFDPRSRRRWRSWPARTPPTSQVVRWTSTAAITPDRGDFQLGGPGSGVRPLAARDDAGAGRVAHKQKSPYRTSGRVRWQADGPLYKIEASDGPRS